MLVEAAIGDAMGAGYEYAPQEKFTTFDFTYVSPEKHHREPGRYTDDTQMSIAIAEALISKEPWTPEFLANRFVACFKRDMRTGYAHAFYDLLCKVADGDELLKVIKPDSDKSGAAMRAAPLGVLPSVADILEKSRIQAKITHNTDAGIKAAQASALTAHYFIYDKGPKASLGKWLLSQVPSDVENGPLRWDLPYEEAVGPKGWQSVRAAITALMTCDTMTDLLKRCILFTGDVDTAATIALAAGSQSKEIAQDLPAHLYDGLENGTYGKDFLVELDRKLMSLKGG